MFSPTTTSHFALFSLEKTLSKYHTNIVSLYFTFGCSHAKRWHIISSYFSRLQRHNRTFGLRLSLDSLLGQKKFRFYFEFKAPTPPLRSLLNSTIAVANTSLAAILSLFSFSPVALSLPCFSSDERSQKLNTRSFFLNIVYLTNKN